MKRLHRWSICLALLLCPQVFAADGLNSGGIRSLTDNGPTFLPVEEAYQLYPRRHDDQLVLQWVIAPGYYLYREQFAVRVAGGELDGAILPQTFEAGVERYDEYFEKNVEVYYGETTVSVPLDAIVTSGHLEVTSQGCADAGLCYPPRTLYVPLDRSGPSLPVLSAPPAGLDAAGVSAPAPTAATALPVILGFALLGGLLLNLMPCVFPVLSIKVLSLSQHSLSSHSRHIHGLVYSSGVILSFLGIALALIAFRAAGESLGWGFQLQSPGFIIALLYLFFVMGLSFSGFFEAGARLMSLGQATAPGSGLQHSFLTGVLATVVASPCSAPFMGTALGFALTQTTAVALLVFAALGLGMALPFVVLTWVPSLLERIPRPGPWMVTLKELLAFPLYLTAVWLLWILGNQTSADVTALVLCGLVLLALGIWLAKGGTTAGRVTAAVALAGALILPVHALMAEKETPLWEPYTAARLEQLLDAEEPVFVNLTADWCISCLANERVALSSEAFSDLLETGGIRYLKGDWTNKNDEITALLNRHGRSGVPLYLFYPSGERNPILLPQILSPAIVRRTLSQE